MGGAWNGSRHRDRVAPHRPESGPNPSLVSLSTGREIQRDRQYGRRRKFYLRPPVTVPSRRSSRSLPASTFSESATIQTKLVKRGRSSDTSVVLLIDAITSDLKALFRFRNLHDSRTPGRSAGRLIGTNRSCR